MWVTHTNDSSQDFKIKVSEEIIKNLYEQAIIYKRVEEMDHIRE